MQGLKFIQNHEGKRVEREFGAKAFFTEDETDEDDETPDEFAINLDLEMEAGRWQIINSQLPKSWRLQDWQSRAPYALLTAKMLVKQSHGCGALTVALWQFGWQKLGALLCES